MSVSLFCEFTTTGKVSCFLNNFEFAVNFIAQTNAGASLYGVASIRARPARGQVKCQKWDYGWLVLRPNGSVFAFSFPFRQFPDIYRHEVPFAFLSDIVDISASGKYVVGIKDDGSLVEWYAAWMPARVAPSAGSLPSGTLSTAVKATDIQLKSPGFQSFASIKPGDLNGIAPELAAYLSAGRTLVLNPVGSYPYVSGETVIITEHELNSDTVIVQRFSGPRDHAAGVRWVVNGAPPAAPAQPTGASANQLAWAEKLLNRVNGSFLPAGNDFVQVCVAQAQGGQGDGPVFGLAVRQNGTIAQWGWFDGSLKGLPEEHLDKGIDGDTKIQGLTGVCQVEVSAYSSYDYGSYYACNAAALLEDGMVVTWSPDYHLGWYDPTKTPVPRYIAFTPRTATWNVAFWNNALAYAPDPAQPFKLGGVVCMPDSTYYIRYRTSATEVHEEYALTLAELSNINTWVELLPSLNATPEMVNRIAEVAGSVTFRGRVYVSPVNVGVVDLTSFSGGREIWVPRGGYSYRENCLKMLGANAVHTVQGIGANVSSVKVPEKSWLWSDENSVGAQISLAPQLLQGIEKVFVSKIIKNVDYIYLKKDNALLSFELSIWNDWPESRRSEFSTDWRAGMKQRIIPHELRITIWPDDSKSNAYEMLYTDKQLTNLNYFPRPNAISSEDFHNYGKIFGVDIVKVNISEAEGIKGNNIWNAYALNYTSYDLSYLLYPSTGTLNVKYGVPQLTRHRGNGCVQSADYWFSPGWAGNCRPSNLEFKVVAGNMLDVPIFFNVTTVCPVLSVSANNLPSWASLRVYPQAEVKSMLNFTENIDGINTTYSQVRPLVRLSGIPDNVGEAQVIPFTLIASNESGDSNPAEFTIIVANVVEIDAEIIASGLVGALFVCIKNFYLDFRCAASIGSVRYADYSAFPNQGEEGAVYEALDTGRAYVWSAGGYVETLARDLMRGVDVIFPIFESGGSLLVGGSWYFYGDPSAAFQANSQLVGRLQTLSLTRFAYGEFNAVPGSRALVFYYTTLNGRITPQPLLSLGVSFFDGDEPEYKKEFIAPRAFDYVSPAGNSVAETEIQIPADGRHGVYNIWATQDLPPGDVKAHVAINLVRE